jgi:hypothetical protein
MTGRWNDGTAVGMPMDVVRALAPELMDEAWDFYREAFDELRTEAVQRHVMHRHEFDVQMADERVLKLVGTEDGRVVGLATLTDDLTAVHLISPDYFQRRWPQLYADRRIWYVVFIATRSGRAGVGMFVQLIRGIVERVSTNDGMIAADICSYNESEYALPEMLRRASGRVAGSARHQLLDSQSYWLYEFPAAS